MSKKKNNDKDIPLKRDKHPYKCSLAKLGHYDARALLYLLPKYKHYFFLKKSNFVLVFERH